MRQGAPDCAYIGMDPLESRILMSVALDSNGWTAITPSSDTHVIYVSSSTGNDANNGLSPSTSVKTIAAGVALLRDGSPDWLLLKKGDTWQGDFGSWKKSGRSADEPLLISAYGSGDRPLVKTGANSGLYTQNDPINYLSIIGIHFYADTRDPASPSYAGNAGGLGIDWLSASQDLLIEDCVFDFYQGNITIQSYPGDFSSGPISNVTIRRNIITNSYSTTSHSQGAYFHNINGLTIEGNLFDHNGWNEQITGAAPTVFNHNIYLDSRNTGVVVKDNIIARASSHGLQARSGGQISGNVFLNNPIGMSFGLVNGSSETPGGVSGFIKDNIFYGSRDINGSPRGYAMEIGNIKPGGTTISGNIMVGDADSVSTAIQLSYGTYQGLPSGTTGINDLTIENNVVYGWASALYTNEKMLPGSTGAYALNNLTVRNNDFQKIIVPRIISHDGILDLAQEHFSSNRYFSTQPESNWFSVNFLPTSFAAWRSAFEPTAIDSEVSYTDPGRTIGDYNGSLGGADSLDAFMQEERAQSKSNWRLQYTALAISNYFRRGFLLPGDLNMDRSVTIADLITLAEHFNQSGQDWSTGDFNGDGLVTISDLIDLVSNFNVIS